LSLLPASAQCLIGKRQLSNAAIQQLQLLTGDRETAYSALFERLVESDWTPVPTKDVLDAERGVILQSFGGSRAAYVNALSAANTSVPVARAILGDQLRRARVQATLPAGTPTASQIQTFYESYPDLSARLVKSTPQPSWLGSPQGFAISQVAPDRLFTLKSGRATTLYTSEGSFRVKLLEDALPLGAVPLRARPGVRELDGREAAVRAQQRDLRARRSASAERRRPDVVPAVLAARLGARAPVRRHALPLARFLGTVQRLVPALEERDRVVVRLQLCDAR
jgi:hypothetical protein